MALCRVALKNLQPKVGGGGVSQKQGWRYGILQRLSLESESGSAGKDVAVNSGVDDDDGVRKGGRWRSLLSRRFRKPSLSLWRRRETHDDHPFEMFTTPGLRNALLEAAENMNRLLENTSLAFPGRFKETEDHYKLKFEVPGLNKDELKVTVDNGVLTIKGEHKVDEDEDDDYRVMSYGYYNTSVSLPEDSKEDDIKAELKDGVLVVTVPKSENHGKDVKEVKIL